MESQDIPLIGHEKSVVRNKYKQSGNVDDEILVNLSHLVTSLDNEGESKNFGPLVDYFHKNHIAQAVQSWSYYAQVNNHAKLIESTILLKRTILLLGSDANVSEYGGNLIKLILNNYIRVLYRGLNNIRASLTIPTIYLMKAMIEFNSGQYIEEFTSSFDFSLQSIPKILTVSKNDISSFNPKNKNHRLHLRFEFIKFWLSLISHCSPLLRRDIMMQNSKIMGAWFKQMDKADTPELMEEAVEVLDLKLVQERAFKKMTKTHILNELALSKIHAFFYSSNKSLVKKVNEFFLAYGADPETSVAFPNNSPWFQESPFNSSTKGAPIKIDQKEFKIHNKLLFNALRSFKPWESDIQASTVLKILDHVPELVPPYCHYLASHGTHEPKMTSYWFGCTMLMGRIINLRIPTSMDNIQTEAVPSLDLVMQAIIPAPLTKISLSKALQHEKILIAQLACQLLVFSFQKLSTVLQFYERKGWASASAPLRNSFYQSIPDLTIITSVMNQSYLTSKNNKIMQLSLTLLLKYYSSTYPNFFSINMPSSNIYMDIMRKDEFSGIDLAIMDNFLQFQELNGTQTKWWNAPAGQNSLFTSLLKMASSKNSTNSVSEKIHQLLKHMFHGTVTFNDILCSPLWVLIHSLQVLLFEDHKSEEVNKIWNLLDETVSRCMKLPYRYVDLSRQYDKISPFLVTLGEQWKFVDRKTSFDAVSKWICILLRSFIICGEPTEGVRKLAKEKLVEVPEEYKNVYLTFENYERKTKKLSSDDFFKLSNFQGTSFFQHITITPYNKLPKVIRYPVNELDAIGLLWRLKNLVHDKDIIFNDTFKEVIDVLLAKLTGFSTSNTSFPLISPEVIKGILPGPASSDNENMKCSFTTQALTQLYHELNLSDSGFAKFVFSWLQDHLSVLQNDKADSLKFSSSLCSCLNIQGAFCLLQNYETIHPKLLKIVLRKVLNGDNTIPYQVFKHAMEIPSLSLDEILAKFIEQDRVEDFQPKDFVSESIVKFPTSFQAFIKSKLSDFDLLLSLLPAIQESEIAIIAALSLQKNDNSAVQKFLQKVVSDCYGKLSYHQCSNDTLKLFSSQLEMLTGDQKLSVLKYVTTDYDKKYSSEAIKFVRLVNNFEEPSVIAWLNKLILYGTKYFSNATELSNDFVLLLSEMEKLTGSVNLWSKVNHVYLQTHLEVILTGTWVNNSRALQYLIHILTKGKSKEVQSTRMLQSILNNEKNALKFEATDAFLRFTTAAAIYILFMLDIQGNSTNIVQSKLFEMYSGTVTCEDQMIFKMIEEIEKVTSYSWVNDFCSLDILEEEENEIPNNLGVKKIILFERGGIFVTLDRNTILNTTSNFPLNRPVFPNQTGWEPLLSFYNRNKIYSADKAGRIYDPTFLMLLSLQNGSDLVTYSIAEDGSTQCKFEIQRYLSSGIFQIILLSLAENGALQKISLKMIYGMLSSLEADNQFKYGHIIATLLKKILFSFEKARIEDKPFRMANTIWFAISNLSEVLTNPGSPLHEKAFRWVLNSPFIASNDFPLLQDLTTPNERSRDFESFYRQLAWVLNSLDLGTKTDEDVYFMKHRNILEWLSNLKNLPYLNARLCTMIDSIFYKVQRLEGGGSTLLTRFASVSNSELQKLSLQQQLEKNATLMVRNKNDKRLIRSKLFLENHGLNTDEILLGYSEIMSSQKRLRLWAEDENQNIIKRVKL